MRNRRWKTVLYYWYPVLVWVGIIALESFAGSAERTAGILLPLLTWLFGHIPAPVFAIVHFAVRKFGHFIGYFILSGLLFRAFLGTFPHPVVRIGKNGPVILERTWRLRWAAMAIVGTFAVAALDELHQSFVPGRTGTWRDVVLDTCAGVVAQQLILTATSFVPQWKKIPIPGVTKPN